MSDTFLCLLCRGVVSSRPNRYEDHLKLEHKVYFHMDWLLQKTKETVAEKSRESPQRSSSTPQFAQKSFKTPQFAQKSLKISKVSMNNEFVNKKIKKENVFAETLLEESAGVSGETVAENVPVEAPPVEQRKVKKVNTFGCSVCPDISFEKKSEALAHLKSHAQDKKTVNKENNKSVKTEPISEPVYDVAQSNVKREIDPINTDEENFTENDDTMNESVADDDKTPELIVEKTGEGRGRTFGCSACPLEKFEQREQAKKHIRGHIPLLDRKQLSCENCKERYATKVSLDKHVPVCQGIQVRACPYKKCEQTFETRYDLNKHIREHKKKKMAEKAEQNKLACKICSKVLKTRRSLKRHLINKHGEESKVAVKVESS